MIKSLNFPMKGIRLSDSEFNLIRERISREYGIILKDEKREILEEIIGERLKDSDIKSLKEYLSFALDGKNQEELLLIVSRLTNKETYFFREMPQLELSLDLLQERVKRKGRLHILSLGCSTGEEVYTMSILIHERGLLSSLRGEVTVISGEVTVGSDIRITGIDIDPVAIKKAREGRYTENSFRNTGPRLSDEVTLKNHLLDRYFIREERFYRIKDLYKEIVDFRQGNILDRNLLSGFVNMDLVLCRNVFIYMNEEAILQCLENIHRTLSSEGYLLLGSAESITSLTDLFIPQYKEGMVIYKKVLAFKRRGIEDFKIRDRRNNGGGGRI